MWLVIDLEITPKSTDRHQASLDFVARATAYRNALKFNCLRNRSPSARVVWIAVGCSVEWQRVGTASNSAREDLPVVPTRRLRRKLLEKSSLPDKATSAASTILTLRFERTGSLNITGAEV